MHEDEGVESTWFDPCSGHGMDRGWCAKSSIHTFKRVSKSLFVGR
jgi:hypothetical protein